jgi:ParB-like chromosome segregation protein Spo0J
MAVRNIEAEEIKRSDLLSITPQDIVVNEDDRGRTTPPSEAVVKNLAVSILEHGQRQAVECRKVGGQLHLNMGFTRHAAVMLIRAGFEHNGAFYQDADHLLKTTVANTNAETAFINNIVENAHRNATTAIDDAFNQHRLRDKYGKTDQEIAKLYQCTITHVQRLASLLGLSSRLQTMVHEGILPVSAAIDLLSVGEDDRDDIVLAALNDAKDKVDGQIVKKLARAWIIAAKKAGKITGKTAKGVTQRTIKEVRAFFEKAALVGGDAGDCAQTIVQFINGDADDEAMQKAWDTLIGA